MTDQPCEAVSEAALEMDAAAGRALRRAERLDELAGIGMRLARAVETQMMEQLEAAQVAAAEDGEPPTAKARAAKVDLGLVFARLSRAIRLTMMLGARLDEGPLEARVQRTRDEAKRAADQERLEFALGGAVRLTKSLVDDVIDQVIDEESDERRERESLRAELHERLEDDEAYDFENAALAELVTAIWKDMGLTTDWREFAGDDWSDADWGDVPDEGPLDDYEPEWWAARPRRGSEDDDDPDELHPPDG